ncbi:MAG: tRNA adenosine(34) deaminase TadA [Clostridia bacterium]|nr:tRNA adenosine(34) deaminase TadA [Clostridia bacterium]
MIFESDNDRCEYFMGKAIEQAKIARSIGEVPVGAVITRNDEIITAAFNRRETGRNALYHAELDAIDKACTILGGWRLWQCELYVTLEPCPMCAGAVINSRIPKVVFGAYDMKSGSAGSLINLFEVPYNHKPEVIGGVLEEECSGMLSEFFAELRIKLKSKRNI